jgi:predicted  nucleic acid-binding Zn-ribbon protein
MSKAKQLYELQEIDLDIIQKTETLEQIKNQIGKDDDLLSARDELDTARKQLVELEHQQRTAEWTVDEAEKKIASEEKKLYEGSVKNPRELMGLQHEVELLKEKHKEREEQLLTVMMQVETAQQEVADKQNELEAIEKDWEAEQKRLAQEKEAFEADLDTLHQKRSAIAGQIDTTSLSTYDELRNVKQGIAVAKLVQGRCQGCRISLPVSDQQKARIGQKLATCSNCGRILNMD